MNSQSPAPWTFAARAAYFGDRVCAFCHHHNPAGAKFCNDCASPLQLKPCNQCDAINDLAATRCHNCGAAFPLSFGPYDATSGVRTAPPTPAGATAADAAVAAIGTQPVFVTSALRAYWRLVRPGQFLLAVAAVMLVAGAYAVHHIDAMSPDGPKEAASQASNARENGARAATPAVATAVEPRPVKPKPAAPGPAEPKPVEPEMNAALQAPPPAIASEAPTPATSRPRSVPIPATKRASAYQRPAPARTSAATPRLAQSRPATRVRAPVAEHRKVPGADAWHAMQVNLARCSGDLIARIVCDQRVRQRFCAGRWGRTPECASFSNEHGQ
jgi:hypothetical protein